MTTERIILALCACLVAVVFLADIILYPGRMLPAVPYALPILIAAYYLPTRMVAVVAVLAFSLQSLAGWLEERTVGIWAVYLLGLALIGFLTTMITARKKTQEALARERAYFIEEFAQHVAELDAIIEAMAEGVVIYNSEGNISHLNPAARRIFGYSQDLSEHPITERWVSEHFETAEGKPLPPKALPVDRALRGETVRGILVSHHRTDSRNGALYSVSSAPVYGSDGKILGAVSVFTDVTSVTPTK